MRVAAFCACLCLAACAGFRGGWESVPYIGDSPPNPSTYRTRTYLLSIDFPVPAPSPDNADGALDLSQALQAPDKPAIPLIRFLPTRWKEGYT